MRTKRFEVSFSCLKISYRLCSMHFWFRYLEDAQAGNSGRYQKIDFSHNIYIFPTHFQNNQNGLSHETERKMPNQLKCPLIAISKKIPRISDPNQLFAIKIKILFVVKNGIFSNLFLFWVHQRFKSKSDFPHKVYENCIFFANVFPRNIKELVFMNWYISLKYTSTESKLYQKFVTLHSALQKMTRIWFLFRSMFFIYVWISPRSTLFDRLWCVAVVLMTNRIKQTVCNVCMCVIH